MQQVPSGWRRTLVLAGTALLIGCDRSPESGDRITGPDFLLTTTPAIGAWTTKAPLPTARYGLGVAAINGILYAVGGYNGSPLSTLEAYDPSTDTWTTRTPMPTARFVFGVAAINGILYAVGGLNSNFQRVATVEAYDPATDTWATKASMPTARVHVGIAAINGTLYALGGLSNSGYLATLEAYDPFTDTWTTKASMTTPRDELGIAAINGILYAVGGVGNGFLATVEAYDPATNSWVTKASMPAARGILGVAATSDILYAVGGYNNSPLATVEAFAPPYAFTGFFQPAENSPVVNTLRAGSAVPVKFTLHGYQGFDIFASGFPTSQGYACTGGSEDAIEQTVTAGSSGLSYDATADQYAYVWKTDRAWAGTCRQFQLKLKDGRVQTALFHFTK